ncbi:MAG: hypothetical protein N2112_11545 [Gemmataceae bacterium]|jgi:hypothetical protein|nr:hypothetical protein [Gemmataceae bacterium]
MYRRTFSTCLILLLGVPTVGVTQSARIGPLDNGSTTSRSSPNDFDDPTPPTPAARLGPITPLKSTGYDRNSDRDRDRYRDTDRERDERPSSKAGSVKPAGGPIEDKWDRPPQDRERKNSFLGMLFDRDRDYDYDRDERRPPPRARDVDDPYWGPGRNNDRDRDRDCDPDDPFFRRRERNRDRDSDEWDFRGERRFRRMASPVTNPFYAEDPRALTELRPIFMYQRIPDSQYYYRGGNLSFFGGQARLALSDRFSVVLNKIGGVNINPGRDSGLPSSTVFTELWLGPKFTFLRDVEDHTIGAFGLTFQLPLGGASFFQNTGSLSLVPYFTYATRLDRTPYGTFGVLNTVGYSFGTSNARSDFLYNTLHLDIDWQDEHRIFPLVELTWFHYTSGGQERPFLAFEGADLANIGASASGRDYLNIAVGARFMLTEAVQFGVAAEFPLLGTRDLNAFRMTFDLIWRY